MPAPSVPSSAVPPYPGVVQVIGACSASDISGYVTACDSATATPTTCQNWFNAANAACANCLAGPANDAGALTGQGGIWLWQGQNIGPNYPGCLDLKGMSSCANADEQVYECILSAGCATCADGTTFQTCADTTINTGGACAGYYATYSSSCASDLADGGLLNGGVCSNANEVLSVICGNGSGDGG